MGPRTVAEFVADCGWDYVLNCLDRGMSSTVFSGDALPTLAKKCIVQRRRQQTGRHDWELGDLSKGATPHGGRRVSEAALRRRQAESAAAEKMD
jgi:hypothetical protein